MGTAAELHGEGCPQADGEHQELPSCFERQRGAADLPGAGLSTLNCAIIPLPAMLLDVPASPFLFVEHDYCQEANLHPVHYGFGVRAIYKQQSKTRGFTRTHGHATSTARTTWSAQLLSTSVPLLFCFPCSASAEPR